MIEAIKLLRQYVGLDENGNLRMGLREVKDLCDAVRKGLASNGEWFDTFEFGSKKGIAT